MFTGAEMSSYYFNRIILTIEQWAKFTCVDRVQDAQRPFVILTADETIEIFQAEALGGLAAVNLP
jgi:hypothetical protein